MHTPNGRRHPNPGYSDQRGDGRRPSGEHEGAYGAQQGGYVSGTDSMDPPDRWSQDLGRHQDRWSHGGYDAADYDRSPNDARMSHASRDEWMSRVFGPRARHGYVRPEFLGKGPKGYTRSDERIREEICERLSEGYLDASDIEVTVQGGEVTLVGTIADRRTKRFAEELVDGVRGVKDIENRLKLRTSGSYEAQKIEAQKTEMQNTEAQKTEVQSKSSQNGAAAHRV